MMTHFLTPEQARAALDIQGKTVREFAKDHDLDEHTVYQVLSGRLKGRRGEAHRASVLLGMKAGTFPPAIPLHDLPPQVQS